MKTLMREGVITSKVDYVPPKDGSNMASELIAAFKRHSNRTLLVDAGKDGKQYTGAQLLDTVGRIATGLIKLAHLETGQAVLTICDHSSQEVLFALGIVLAGGALFGSTSNEGYEEEKTLCKLVKPNVIVAKSNLHQLMMKLKKDLPSLHDTRIVWMDNPLKQAADLNGISSNNNNNDDFQYYVDLIQHDQVILFDDLIGCSFDQQLINDVSEKRIDAKRDHLTFLLTSGSTGRPKVVPNTHEELVHGIYSMFSACGLPKMRDDKDKQEDEEEARCNGKRKKLMAMSQDCVFAGDLPLDHGAGANTIFLSLSLGAKLIVTPAYDVDAFWQAVHDHRITTSIASTYFTYKLLLRLRDLIDTNQISKYDLSCFKSISCAGSKLTFGPLIKQINEVYPQLYIGQCYGCTEIGFISTHYGQECRERLDSVGYLMPGLLAKVIRPETGKICGLNERGELLLWANSKFKGYRCHPDDDALALLSACHDEDGFYKTGDEAHFDSDGRLYVHGRYKETLVLLEDWKILPAELEEVIDQHPLVERSAVVGMRDLILKGFDAPRAFIKLISTESKEFKQSTGHNELKERLKARDLDFIERDIFQFVADRTAKPKHLSGGIRFLDNFPMNGILNKVDKKALKLIE